MRRGAPACSRRVRHRTTRAGMLFFFNDTATTEIYTLSLHDALPILDSDFCDPLEFRGDSALGVPGLVEAVRAGGVVLAKGLGGGVVEPPVMDAYLPNVARALLSEDLKIPDIDTIWCGTEWGRKEALGRLDHAILRDAFDARPMVSRRSSARLGTDMSAAD